MKIWKEKEDKQEGFLKLEQLDDGVAVVMVDEDGDELESGYILVIKNNGRLIRSRSCEAIGIDTNGDGRIKLDE